MYLISLFLTIISAFFSGFFGKKIGFFGASRLPIYCLFIAFLSSLFLFYEVAFLNSPVFIILSCWIYSDILNINWGFIFDTLTVTMAVIVTFISFLVHVYSLEYMAHDPHLPRFMAYLSLFTFFMLILISADNFIQMFVGWEGVGLCSYLLINFWFTRIQANKAAIKAMIINRIGDFSLVIGILILFINFKSLDYSVVAVLVPFFKNHQFNLFFFKFHMITAVCFFLFVGAVGKSAQIGLHTWLPDAMEGPTPVSALIHAATMVTAGVFLIARTCFLFEYSFNVLEIIGLVGATTAFLASSVGLVQNDLKRVIAYSTCSQLGYMVFACGLSSYSVGVFHLSNHAFFKALLFLSAGSVIHAVNDEQDMRKMGGLRNLLPVTYFAIVAGSLALIGFPFLTGFYSKDLILELAFSKHTIAGYFCYFFGTCGAFFTAFYSTRLLFLTFLVKPNGFKKIICFAVDSGFIIKAVLALLIIPTIFIGYFSKEMFVGLGSNFFETTMFFTVLANGFDAEFSPVFAKTLPVHFSLAGSLLAFFLYSFRLDFVFKFKFFVKNIYTFLNKKWYFDKIYNELLASFFFKYGYTFSYKFVDRGIFELLGPTGLAFLFLNFGTFLHKAQTNFIYHLSLTILFSLTIFCFFETILLLFKNNDYLTHFSEYQNILNYFFAFLQNMSSFEFFFLITSLLVVLYFKSDAN